MDNSTFLWLFPLSWSKPTAAGATAENRIFSVFSWLAWPWLEIITEKTRGFETKLISSENGTNLLFNELSEIRGEACVLECVVPNALYSPSFLCSSCLHHITSDYMFWFPQVCFSLHLISLLSFSSPLPLFMTPWWAEGPDLRLLGQETSTCATAGMLQNNPTSFGPSVSAQPHFPPGVSDQDAAIYWHQQCNSCFHPCHCF